MTKTVRAKFNGPMIHKVAGPRARPANLAADLADRRRLVSFRWAKLRATGGTNADFRFVADVVTLRNVCHVSALRPNGRDGVDEKRDRNGVLSRTDDTFVSFPNQPVLGVVG